MSLDKFARTVELIRERCDIILNLTTSGGRGIPLTDEDRFARLMLGPEMCSINSGNRVLPNSPAFLRKLGEAAVKVNVKPEIAEFNTEFVTRIVRLTGEFERPVATVAEAREILKLKPRA